MFIYSTTVRSVIVRKSSHTACQFVGILSIIINLRGQNGYQVQVRILEFNGYQVQVQITEVKNI